MMLSQKSFEERLYLLIMVLVALVSGAFGWLGCLVWHVH